MSQHGELTEDQLTVSPLLPLHGELFGMQAHSVSCKLMESSQQAHSVSSSCELTECPQNEPTMSFNMSAQ